MEIVRGLVVRSAAGHDKGGYFIVLAADGKQAVICDGKRRSLSKTKKKSVIHLYGTNTVVPEASMETNREIRNALRPFNGQKPQCST